MFYGESGLVTVDGYKYKYTREPCHEIHCDKKNCLGKLSLPGVPLCGYKKEEPRFKIDRLETFVIRGGQEIVF